MNQYKHNIVVSSLQKSGTVLSVSIIKELTKLESIQKSFKEDGVIFGGIDSVTDNEIFIYKNYCNSDNAIYKYEKVDISSFINFKKKSLYIGHASPKSIANNKILNKISKKIYIYRYGLDVLNSKMKFIENLDYVLALMQGLKDQKKYQALRYATPEKVLETLRNWEENVRGYLMNKEIFYAIKYEDLLENPSSEIQKLAQYLEISISSEEIDKIIQKLFYKELSGTKLKHSYYKHYNNTKKVQEWINFLPYKFYEKFEIKNKEILKQLDYQLLSIQPYENNKFHNIFERKINSYKENKNDNNFLNVPKEFFIESVNKYLDGKKIAIYGTGRYSKYIQSKLNNSVEVVMVCDDNYEKLKDKSVVSPKELLKQILNFDYILIMLKDEKKINKSIKKILRLHGGVEIFSAFHNELFEDIKD